MRSHPAFVESLESRRLLAGASVVGDALMVTANQRAATTNVQIVENDDRSAVSVTINAVTRRGVAKQFTASFPKSLGYSRVVVRGGAGDDTIEFFANIQPTFSLPVRVNGRAGNDIINTGTADDVVVGGKGDDVISTGAGNDTVHAQAGNDTVLGGDGDDTLWGGGGDDRVEGNAGNDKLGGILGTNAMFGGDGTDELVVQSLDLNPDNDFVDGTDVLTIRQPRQQRDELASPRI